jgi:hypothetical protein
MWGQPEESRTYPFRAFFQASLVMGRPEKGYLLWGPGGGEKCVKKAGATANYLSV